jgi:FixJ family two-component response regulator
LARAVWTSVASSSGSILMASERAREAGADAFLRKPLAERRLVDTVKALLDMRRETDGV